MYSDCQADCDAKVCNRLGSRDQVQDLVRCESLLLLIGHNYDENGASKDKKHRSDVIQRHKLLTKPLPGDEDVHYDGRARVACDQSEITER